MEGVQEANMQSRDVAVGLFHGRDDAEDAINALKDAGISAEDVSVVARDRDTDGTLAEDTGSEAGTGAATGALAGGVLGGVAGWLIGIGALAIPGVGPIIAAGPLAAALGGAALGAAGGGLIGALTGAGVPEDEAKWYDERVRSGGILVSVRAPGRYGEAMSIMRENSGRDYSMAGDTAHQSWEQTSPEFRNRYERTYGSKSDWNTTEPAHRFGYEAYGQYGRGDTDRNWRSVEPDLRRDWESRGSGTWEENRSHVRHGYDWGRGRRNFRDYDDDDTVETVGGAAG
jgi:Heat induced stress protein YflT domain